MEEMFRCERCGRTTRDPDKWDIQPFGPVLCDVCWSPSEQRRSNYKPLTAAEFHTLGSLLDRLICAIDDGHLSGNSESLVAAYNRVDELMQTRRKIASR